MSPLLVPESHGAMSAPEPMDHCRRGATAVFCLVTYSVSVPNSEPDVLPMLRTSCWLYSAISQLISSRFDHDISKRVKWGNGAMSRCNDAIHDAMVQYLDSRPPHEIDKTANSCCSIPQVISNLQGSVIRIFEVLNYWTTNLLKFRRL